MSSCSGYSRGRRSYPRVEASRGVPSCCAVAGRVGAACRAPCKLQGPWRDYTSLCCSQTDHQRAPHTQTTPHCCRGTSLTEPVLCSAGCWCCRSGKAPGVAAYPLASRPTHPLHPQSSLQTRSSLHQCVCGLTVIPKNSTFFPGKLAELKAESVPMGVREFPIKPLFLLTHTHTVTHTLTQMLLEALNV